MLLLEGNVLRKVFMVYTGFWLLVIVGLFVAVGLLMKKQERQTRQRQQDNVGH